MYDDIKRVRYDGKIHAELAAERGKVLESVNELSARIRDKFNDTDKTDQSDAEHARMVMQHTAESKDLERLDRELYRMEISRPSSKFDISNASAFARWTKGGTKALGANEVKDHVTTNLNNLPAIADEVGLGGTDAALMLDGVVLPRGVQNVEYFIEKNTTSFTPQATVRTDVSPGGEDWTPLDVAPTWGFGQTLKLISGVNGKTSELRTSHGLPMKFPTVNDTSESGEWFTNQASSVTDGDYTPDNVQVGTQIHSSKRISQSLAAEADVAMLERVARSNLDRRHARGIETAMVTGTGANDTPRGLTIDAELGVTTNANTALEGNDFVKAIDTIDLAYMEGEGSPAGLNPPSGNVHRGFAFSQNTLGLARLIKDNDGQYLWRPGLAGLAYGDPPTIAGFPYVISNAFANLAASANIAIFGNLGYYFKRVAGMRVIARFFDSGTASTFSTQYISFIRAGGRAIGGFSDVSVAQPKTEAYKIIRVKA